MKHIRKVLSVMICLVMIGMLGATNIVASGTMITTTVPDHHTLQFQIEGMGNVKVNGKTIDDGEMVNVERLKNIEIQIKGKKGYQLEKLLVDDGNHLDEMNGNTFMIKEVCEDHKINIVFHENGEKEEVTPDQVGEDIEQLPDVKDYDQLTPEQKEEIKEQVDNIVENIETMDKETQKEMKQESVIKIAELYDKIYNVKIVKDTSAAKGLPTQVDPEDIQVIGAGMAAKALGGHVKVTVTQDIPTIGSMAFTMKLYVMKDGEKVYHEVELATPLVFQVNLPKNIKTKGLLVNHYEDHGELKEVLVPEIKGNVASVMTTSFSTFEFIEEKEKKDPIIVDTGDHNQLAVMVSMFMISGCIMLGIRKRMKQK